MKRLKTIIGVRFSNILRENCAGMKPDTRLCPGFHRGALLLDQTEGDVELDGVHSEAGVWRPGRTELSPRRTLLLIGTDFWSDLLRVATGK
ncbi:uncharacterized protein PGTG_20664 [Puccinia graminis f. sp. tritici CRL 75-36-700-3]|uniref:Uncharacterized protein n=1 Tax=Puccinia graminis f. sp. tritici (strain CRL 75-36-700-3 / race SCCL) TaxID=418459 RepID=H6QP94_PUCGT|nr:uncharacterized protein PGTG_20664 [Puccinia graminis f. sp. tritici CRL 75-36-700-3]EHS63568.1 hypothetical protein PGTG_20664 [Puccinia graminis f. sp. tritici CRL 75-36-700-3]